MTSTRLPNKIYRAINGVPLLFHAIANAKESVLLDDLIVASPHELPDLPDDTKQFISRGPENDVLGRFYECFQHYPCDYVVRLTADCPLLDPHLIDFIIQEGQGSDYCSNVLEPGFPDGSDIEMMSSATLEYLNAVAQTDYHREHVTTLLRQERSVQQRLNMVSVLPLMDWSGIKTSVDTEEDLARVISLESQLR